MDNLDDLEKLDDEALGARVKAMNEGMQDAFLQALRTAFCHDSLVLDRNKLGALDVILTPPCEGDDEDDQAELDKDYNECLALAMPLVRYIVPEVYTLEQQQAMFDFVKEHADETWQGKNANVPVPTVAGVLMYDPGVLHFVLDNPFNSLNEDDHRMLVVFRITLNL